MYRNFRTKSGKWKNLKPRKELIGKQNSIGKTMNKVRERVRMKARPMAKVVIYIWQSTRAVRAPGDQL